MPHPHRHDLSPASRHAGLRVGRMEIHRSLPRGATPAPAPKTAEATAVLRQAVRGRHRG